MGTTAVKAVVVSADGDLLTDAEVEQPITVPRPGWAEQRPDMWRRNATAAARQAIAEAQGAHGRIDIAAVGLTGQMHSSVFLDCDGEVIRPAILWNDTRTTPQRRFIADTLGMDGLHRGIANLPLEGFTAPKLLWLRDNEPENYARLRMLLLPKDYIRFWLTSDYATEPSDAAGTALFDVRRLRWAQPTLDALGLDADILPPVAGSTEITGAVSRAAADALGIRPGIPVVGGGADNAAGAIGCGVARADVMQVSIGTSGTLLLPTARPVVAPDMSLHTFCHCAPDLWYLMGTILSAGSALRWLRDTLGGGVSYETLTADAATAPPGSDGLLFLPYLSGERTPHNDANARGVFFGLHASHNRSHLARAVMEGVCFALRDSLELMREQGASPQSARIIGGGARSRLWRQICADAFGLPIATTHPNAGPAYGAALLAAVGCGIFADVRQAVEARVKPGAAVHPNPANAAAYNELYRAYRRLYPALKERFADLAEFAERRRR